MCAGPLFQRQRSVSEERDDEIFEAPEQKQPPPARLGPNGLGPAEWLGMAVACVCAAVRRSCLLPNAHLYWLV
jgi:hypothetical protein